MECGKSEPQGRSSQHSSLRGKTLKAPGRSPQAGFTLTATHGASVPATKDASESPKKPTCYMAKAAAQSFLQEMTYSA